MRPPCTAARWRATPARPRAAAAHGGDAAAHSDAMDLPHDPDQERGQHECDVHGATNLPSARYAASPPTSWATTANAAAGAPCGALTANGTRRWPPDGTTVGGPGNANSRPGPSPVS